MAERANDSPPSSEAVPGIGRTATNSPSWRLARSLLSDYSTMGWPLTEAILLGDLALRLGKPIQ